MRVRKRSPRLILTTLDHRSGDERQWRISTWYLAYAIRFFKSKDESPSGQNTITLLLGPWSWSMVLYMCGNQVPTLIYHLQSLWRMLRWCNFHYSQPPYSSFLLSWWTCGRSQFLSNRPLLLIVKRHSWQGQVSRRWLPNVAEYDIFTRLN